MNERIKKLRKSLGLTQTEFGDRIGIKQASVGLIESGKNSPSDQTILSICREFGVREEWLREGAEPMKEPEPVDELEELFRRYNATPEIRMMVKMFLESPPPVKAWIAEKVQEIKATGTISFPTPKPSPLGKVAEAKPLTDEVIDEMTAEYRRELELEASQAARSSASSGQGGK